MASMSLPSGKVIVRRTTSPFTILVTMSSRLMAPVSSYSPARSFAGVAPRDDQGAEDVGVPDQAEVAELSADVAHAGAGS